MSVLSLGQVFGRVSSQWGTRALMLTPVIHEQRRTNVAHAHEAAFVAMVLDGEYTETAAQRSIRYDRFSAIHHPAGIEHQDAIGGPGVRLLMFEYRPELLDALPRAAEARSIRDLSGSRIAWELVSLYRDAATRHDELDFESRALGIIGGLTGVSERIPRDLPSLNRACEYLRAHFRDRITMRDVADAAGIHPVYLGQMFRRETGETIAGHVARLRVRAAGERLCHDTAPLAAIALDHGFSDQSHFQRVFKQVSGFTPSAFRRKFALRAG